MRRVNLRGLYVQLFVAFWVAMLLVVAGTVLLFELSSPPEFVGQRRAFEAEAMRLQGARIVALLESHELAEATSALSTWSAETGVSAAILEDEEVLVATDLAVAGQHYAVLEALPFDPVSRSRKTRREQWALEEYKLSGDYTIMSWRPRPTRFEFMVGPRFGERMILMIVIAALLALLLARYLSRPLRALRSVARELADGDLDVRVRDRVRGATSEVEALGVELDRMAARLSQLLGAQSRLLRDVSHELRSPLARLQVALELARRDQGESPHLDRIERETERLGQLIGQILTLARMQGQEFEKKRVDVAALVEQVAADASYETGGREVRVTTGSHDAFVLGNDEVLRWAFDNVIRNALRYTGETGDVNVAFDRTTAEIVVSVHDDGPGVPDDELEAIFTPFYRVDSARDRQRGGYGVGLAVAAGAVRGHGGRIEAENDGGLLVRIALPIAA